MSITQDPAAPLLRKTYVISLLVSVLLLFVKFGAFSITQSRAIFSDALESVINVITPLFGLWVIWVAAKPADEEHPYGHGKVEYFSAAFEGGLILFAGVMILIEAVRSVIEGVNVRQLDIGLALVTFAGIVNWILGYFVLKMGEKHKSQAVQANGRHILSDVWTTAGVLIGLFLVKFTGIIWFDPIAAGVVGALLAFDGFKIVRESTGGLMDEKDTELVQNLANLFKKYHRPGIIHIHALRIMRSGRYHHIDAHVVVPEFWDVVTTHQETGLFEDEVIRDYPVDGEIHFHVDPCRRVYCKFCGVEECPIREDKFEQPIPFTVGSLLDPEEPAEFRNV